MSFHVSLAYDAEVENTGAAHAFYDKFPIRHNIASIIKYIWTSSEHQNTIIELSKCALPYMFPLY